MNQFSLSILHNTVESGIIVSSSCMTKWFYHFIHVICLNHATFHKTEPIIMLSTVHKHSSKVAKEVTDAGINP